MAKISTYIIGVIVFTLFIFGGVAMISEFVKVDNTIIDSSSAGKYVQFNNTFNKYQTLTTSVDNLEQGVKDAPDNFGVFGVLNGLIETAWNTITTIFTSFAFMDDAINGLNVMFHIPKWVTTLVLAIISIILVFAIFGAIFQRDI